MAEREYLTDDLGIASLLVAKGIPYTGLRATESWKAELVFDTSVPEDAAAVATLLRGWRTGTIEVGAQAFWRASRDLKHEVKQFTENQRRR